MNKGNKSLPLGRALGVVLMLGYADLASHGGWTGWMNGYGVGWAGTSVTSSQSTYSKSVLIENVSSPSAAIPMGFKYLVEGSLPRFASSLSTARLAGIAPCIWQGYTFAANGDGTDNPELEKRVVIKPAICASVEMDSILPTTGDGAFDEDTGSGAITVKTKATGGTALLLRGFEVPPGTVVPVDIESTEENEAIEFLKENGLLKFENLLVGPFNYGYGTCPLIIFFTLENKDLGNLIFTSDAVAKSTKVALVPPGPQTTPCGASYVYPPVGVTGSCSDLLRYTCSPPESGLVPGLNTVTVNLFEEGKEDDVLATCTFTVNVVDATPPTFVNCPDNITIPSSADACGAVATWEPPTVSDPCGISSLVPNYPPGHFFPLGTTTVTYTATDKAGNSAIVCSFTVKVTDQTAPPIPSLPDVTGTCGDAITLTKPTTTDKCGGLITGTTQTVFPITQAGTTTVIWSFTDGNNPVTANQKVIISGLQFFGFYSPLSADEGRCDAVSKVIKLGSKIPIKFDFGCGSNVTSGPAPYIEIQKWTDNCGSNTTALRVAAVYNRDWHFNWDTGVGPWAAGVYKIIAILPDNTTHSVFIRLK